MEPTRPNPFRLAAVAAPVPASLPTNTVLGSHLVDDFLCHDGIVATYLGHHLISGDAVLIREYFPVDLATRGPDGFLAPTSVNGHAAFADGLTRFIDCAQRLQRASSPYLPPVVELLEANDTAYLVSAESAGENLDRWLSRSAPLSDEQITDIAIGILRALDRLLDVGLCHRDVHEAQVQILDGGDLVLRHVETLLHGTHPAHAANGGGARADLSALSALLTRLCHAGAESANGGAAVVPRERSQMLMMLIERGLPGSRELDSLDAARWCKSFERLRAHLNNGSGGRGAETLPAPPQWLRPESVVVGQVAPAAPVFPIVADAGEREKTAEPVHDRGLAGRLATWIEVALVPVLLVVAWFLLPHPDRSSSTAAVTGPVVSSDVDAGGDAPPPPTETKAVAEALGTAAEPAPDSPEEAPTLLDGNDGNALPSTAVVASNETAPSPDEPAATDLAVPPTEQTAAPGGEEVSKLLAAAAADVAARRMTVPAGNNAMEKFQAVLRLDRGNAEARQGLRQIADGLAATARKRLDAGDEAGAEALIRRARAADARNARVDAVEQALAARRKAAELPRIDEPYPPRVEVAPPPPPPPAPPPVEEASSRSDEIRQRFGGR